VGADGSMGGGSKWELAIQFIVAVGFLYWLHGKVEGWW